MLFRTCVGPPADGSNFFQRPYLDRQFWQYVQNGSHLLISAPRRVGKTSFLKNTRHKDFQLKYLTTEASNQSNEFFKKLYKCLLQELSQKESLWERLSDILKRNQIEKLGTGGIEIKASNLDYFEEFKLLLKKVNLERIIVFVIDEFSEALENIIMDQGNHQARVFLQQNRELRQDPDIIQVARFVYSGSIGLGNIAERIGGIKNINDLTDFTIPSFTVDEGKALIDKIIDEPDKVEFNDEMKEYLLNRIHWLMPYYIQVVLDEVNNLLREENTVVIDQNVIDRAIQNALAKRNYFEHWHTRLRTAFKGAHYSFAKEVLNRTAKENVINKSHLYDTAVRHDIEDTYQTIVRALEYDGYISMNEEGAYVFNSPLLRIWWERYITI